MILLPVSCPVCVFPSYEFDTMSNLSGNVGWDVRVCVVVVVVVVGGVVVVE